MKGTVENRRGSVEKLSPKESVEGANTVLRGNVRAPKEFSEGKPEAAKPRGRSPQVFTAKGLPEKNPKGALTLPSSRESVTEAISRGDSFSTLPKAFQQLITPDLLNVSNITNSVGVKLSRLA